MTCAGCGKPIEPGQWFTEVFDGTFHAGWPDSPTPDCVPGVVSPIGDREGNDANP